MNFFEHQDRARAVSRRLYVLYSLTLLGALLTLNAITLTLVHFAQTSDTKREVQETARSYDSSYPRSDPKLKITRRTSAPPPPSSFREVTLQDELPALIGTAALTTLSALAIIGIATGVKVAQLGGDGARVAELLGGRPLTGQPADLNERKLVNVVEEMSIASGVPMPRLYLLDEEQGINAFAAGTRSEAAVIGVTRGAIEKLSRDELQGVIAHEFSHILNGDMRVNLRLIGLNFGLIALGYLGLQTMRFTAQVMPRGDRKGNAAAIAVAILIIAAAMAVVGYVGTLFGKILQAAVSRQREFLADASAVQFTRNPRGIGNALKKVGGLAGGAQLATPNAGEASHMFFADGVAGFLDSIFATHPPIEQRIRAIDATLLTEPIPELPPMPTMSAAPGMEGVAGFSGGESYRPAATMTRVTIAPEQIVNTDRGVASSQVDAAARFLESLPASLLDLAREPYGARAIAIGLLLDADEATRAAQLQRMAAVDEPLAQLVMRHASIFATADPAVRLPLLDRALPSLRQLAPTQLSTFRELCEVLAQADATISPFETALLAILDNELGLRATSSNVGRGGPGSVSAAVAPISVVLSSLAVAGGSSQADRAFDRGVAQLGLPPGTVQPASQYDANALLTALGTLRRSPLGVRRRVIEAAAHCVIADGSVGVAELELMRAISASLCVSIPPLLAQA